MPLQGDIPEAYGEAFASCRLPLAHNPIAEQAPPMTTLRADAPKKLLDQMRESLRTRHYSLRTEDAYVEWIRRFILFHNKRHPREMGSAEIEAFLTHLAVEGNVAASTQNQALSALLFLYREVLKIEFDAPLDAIRAKKPARLPVVLTRAETRQVIDGMSGIYQLMAKLLYGSGLRLMECVRLRVKACPE